jgi:hypothetical protein
MARLGRTRRSDQEGGQSGRRKLGRPPALYMFMVFGLTIFGACGKENSLLQDDLPWSWGTLTVTGADELLPEPSLHFTFSV